MNYITILDFSTGIVYIREIPTILREAQASEIMDYFEQQLKIRERDCEYMVTEVDNFLDKNF